MAEEYQKARSHEINQLLSKFRNGFELYQTNALFNKCVEAMLNGVSPYEIIEQVISIQTSTQKRLNDIMLSGAIRQEIVVSKEKFEELESEIKKEKL